MCVYNCRHTQHRAVLVIFLLNLHTNIIVLMQSTEGRGNTRHAVTINCLNVSLQLFTDCISPHYMTVELIVKLTKCPSVYTLPFQPTRI